MAIGSVQASQGFSSSVISSSFGADQSSALNLANSVSAFQADQGFSVIGSGDDNGLSTAASFAQNGSNGLSTAAGLSGTGSTVNFLA